MSVSGKPPPPSLSRPPPGGSGRPPPSLSRPPPGGSGRPPPSLSRPPPGGPLGITCFELHELATLPHYILRVDRRCRLLMAQRTTTPFDDARAIRDCFRAVERSLAEIPRETYHLLVDTRMGPSRNDPGFERVVEEERGKLLFGFARNAALAATAAGRLQIQRFAKKDGREVLATDDPARAFEYLGLRPHLL